MKNIEIDEELYQYIATNTQFIGESASAILRRLLNLGVEAKLEPVTVNESPDVVAVNTLIESETEAIAAQAETTELEESKSKTVTNLVSQCNETVFNFINKEELAMQRGAVGRFLLILAALYRAHPEQFGVVNRK